MERLARPPIKERNFIRTGDLYLEPVHGLEGPPKLTCPDCGSKVLIGESKDGSDTLYACHACDYRYVEQPSE